MPLAIETGRFQNKTPEERLCTVCTSSGIENELHFFCVCTAYIAPRQRMYEAVCQTISNNEFNDMTDTDKMIYILTCHWKSAAKYIDEAWCIRTHLLYV